MDGRPVWVYPVAVMRSPKGTTMGQQRDETPANEEPLLNIGAVSRMTDIPETTLRVWERRYDFLRSARTAAPAVFAARGDAPAMGQASH